MESSTFLLKNLFVFWIKNKKSIGNFSKIWKELALCQILEIDINQLI